MRYFALADDPTAGGTNFDAIAGLTGAALPKPLASDAVVVQNANVEPGPSNLDRDDDVRNRRAGTAPINFRAAPSVTFAERAWTKMSKRLLRKAMGGSIVTTGGPGPAAFQSTVQMAQSGNLPALIATLVREAQVDTVSGCWVNELTFNFPADGEGTIEGSLMGLYHTVADIAGVSGLPNPAGMPDQADAYMLRDVKAYVGSTPTQIDCLGGFGFTLNNNLSDEPRTRFCAGENIWSATVDGVAHKLWYPKRNRLQQQTVTGRLDFGDVRPDRELRRILSHADKLVVDLAAGPLGTTPAADEMMRLVFYKTVLTGGGAEQLAREGDMQSSYEFGAYIDEATGKDFEAVFTGTAALT